MATPKTSHPRPSFNDYQQATPMQDPRNPLSRHQRQSVHSKLSSVQPSPPPSSEDASKMMARSKQRKFRRNQNKLKINHLLEDDRSLVKAQKDEIAQLKHQRESIFSQSSELNQLKEKMRQKGRIAPWLQSFETSHLSSGPDIMSRMTSFNGQPVDMYSGNQVFVRKSMNQSKAALKQMNHRYRSQVDAFLRTEKTPMQDPVDNMTKSPVFIIQTNHPSSKVSSPDDKSRSSKYNANPIGSSSNSSSAGKTHPFKSQHNSIKSGTLLRKTKTIRFGNLSAEKRVKSLNQTQRVYLPKDDDEHSSIEDPMSLNTKNLQVTRPAPSGYLLKRTFQLFKAASPSPNDETASVTPMTDNFARKNYQSHDAFLRAKNTKGSVKVIEPIADSQLPKFFKHQRQKSQMNRAHPLDRESALLKGLPIFDMYTQHFQSAAKVEPEDLRLPSINHRQFNLIKKNKVQLVFQTCFAKNKVSSENFGSGHLSPAECARLENVDEAVNGILQEHVSQSVKTYKKNLRLQKHERIKSKLEQKIHQIEFEREQEKQEHDRVILNQSEVQKKPVGRSVFLLKNDAAPASRSEQKKKEPNCTILKKPYEEMTRKERLQEPQILFNQFKKDLEYEKLLASYQKLVANLATDTKSDNGQGLENTEEKPELSHQQKTAQKEQELERLQVTNFKSSIAKIIARTREHKVKAEDFSKKKMDILASATDFIKTFEVVCSKDQSPLEQLKWIRSYLAELKEHKKELMRRKSEGGGLDDEYLSTSSEEEVGDSGFLKKLQRQISQSSAS